MLYDILYKGVNAMYNISQRIKNRRIELRMSQQELADKLGYTSRSSITKIEKGTNDIPRTKIIEIANALQTTPSYLMGWDNGVRLFPKNLKNLMESKMMDVETLSSNTSIPVNSLNGFLSDLQDPTMGELSKIANFFCVKKSELLDKDLFSCAVNEADKKLQELLLSLNEDGKHKVLEYINDLSDKYRNN